MKPTKPSASSTFLASVFAYFSDSAVHSWMFQRPLMSMLSNMRPITLDSRALTPGALQATA